MRFLSLFSLVLVAVGQLNASGSDPLQVEIIKRYPYGEAMLGALGQARDGRFGGIEYLGIGDWAFSSITLTGQRRFIERLAETDTPRRVQSRLLPYQNGGWIGAFDGGVFTFEKRGSTTLLGTFGADEGKPTGDFVLGPDGNYYGLSRRGDHQTRNFFRLTPEGAYTALHEFLPPYAVETPQSTNGFGVFVTQLTVGADGMFYATRAERQTYDRKTLQLVALSSDGAIREGAVLENIETSGLQALPDGRLATIAWASPGVLAPYTPTLSTFDTNGNLTPLLDLTSYLANHETPAIVGYLPGSERIIVTVGFNPARLLAISLSGDIQEIPLTDGGLPLIGFAGTIAHDGHLYGCAFRERTGRHPGRSVFLRIVDPAATVTNLPPIARDDFVPAPREGEPGEIAELTLRPLDNDEDADDDPLSIVAADADVPISVVVSPDAREITLTFPAGASPEATVRYRISDGRGGTAEAKVFVRTPRRAGYYRGALSYDPNDAFTVAGFIGFNVTRLGRVTGTLRHSGKRYSLNGQLSPDGSLSLSFGECTLSLHEEGNVFRGEVAFPLDFKFSVSASRPATTRAAGAYTAVIRPRDSRVPAGTGWALVRVGQSGRVTLAGRLADGTAISHGSAVDRAQQIPIYCSPRRRTEPEPGEFGGIISLIPGDGYHGSGKFVWSQPSDNGPFRPAQFAGSAIMLLSRYTAPSAAASPIFPLASVTVPAQTLVSGGQLPAPLQFPTAVGADAFQSQSSDVYQRGIFFRPNGRVTGWMSHPSRGGVVAFSGVVFQATASAEGFFIASDGATRKSGSFRLAPK